MGPTALLPLRGKEPANLGTKGQHATPRPPKPSIIESHNMCINNAIINNYGKLHSLISSKFTDNLGRRPQKCTPPLAYGHVKIQPQVRRPRRLVSHSDTHFASCTEIQNYRFFTVYRQTKVCDQHTAVAPPYRRHKNTHTDGCTRMCLKLKQDLEY